MKRIFSFLLVAFACSLPFLYGKWVEQTKFLEYEAETAYAVVEVDIATPAATTKTLLTCDGGTVATSMGADTAYVCYDGMAQVISFDSTTTSTDNFQYVVTDANGVILGLPPADMVDFTAAGPGECWVWGLSYTGNLTAAVGDTASKVDLSDDCFDLSDNFVVVFRDTVSGGRVYSSFSTDTVHVCIDDATAAISFISMEAVGPNFGYVVTDTAGKILGLPPANMVDFSGAGIGECWVWGLSYTGDVTAQVGDTATSVALASGCFDLSDNFVVVLRDSMDIDGGRVYTESQMDTVYVCYDGMTQVISLDSMGTAGPNFTYVVTDTDGKILGVPPGDMVDFTAAGPGECWVWGLSYSGNLTAQLGDTAGITALSDGCFELSENFVVALRDTVSGGRVYSSFATDTVNVCIDDATPSVSFISMEAVGPNFAYVVTDASGTILGLPPGNTVDFSGAGIGECWVWGLSYTGEVTAQIGDDATAVALASGCFDLSDNFVVVLRDSMDIDGGRVYTEAQQDTVYVCYNGMPQVISMDSMGTAGPNFTYVVTDVDGKILGVPPGDMVDFTAAGPGECWVWGLSYSGNLTAQLGDTAGITALSDGCFELSENFVVALRDTVSGGRVYTSFATDTVHVCIDSATAPISFISMEAVGPNFAYVVTDNAGNILGLPPANMVDFSGAGIGECWVWGLSYTGEVTAMVGDNANDVALASGCFDLSDNFVVVFRDSMDIDGGRVYTESQMDTVYVCYDGMAQVIAMDSMGTAGPNFTYVVTDVDGKILGVPPADMVDFTAAGPGECWVWGLSYSGNLIAQVGDTAGITVLSDGCFELSENFVVALRDSVNGGTVSAGGADTVEVCINDSTSIVEFSSSDATGMNFGYVVTDTNGVILGLPPGNTVDFSGAGVGECWVWGLSYSGEVLAQVGDTATAGPLTSGCFDLSDDFVVVLRDSNCFATGIEEELGLVEFNIYPNPTEDRVIVSFLANQPIRQDVQLRVFSLNGQLLDTKSYGATGSSRFEAELDLSRYEDGLYLIQIQNNEGIYHQKVMKR